MSSLWTASLSAESPESVSPKNDGTWEEQLGVALSYSVLFRISSASSIKVGSFWVTCAVGVQSYLNEASSGFVLFRKCLHKRERDRSTFLILQIDNYLEGFNSAPSSSSSQFLSILAT
jgi:hypothetical protein